MKSYQKPFLGAAYYPEAWENIDPAYDIQKMKEAGITCARIAEFAWSRMEPSPGVFEFDWLHDIIDRLGDAGISVLLCTPTATPPVWLVEEYPDVTIMDDTYIHIKHGGRRHCCTNHPKYVEYSLRIVEEMAKEFGTDENVIGWQIDNEILPQDCHCPYCQNGYRKHLKDKYKTIDNLNNAWNLNLFSQHYTSFEQIPFPDRGWQSPHPKLEVRLFQGKTQAGFVKEQIRILKKYTKAPIGTDTKPLNGLDHEMLTEDCDVIQYNHYPDVENLCEQGFWFDYMRALKDRPFWVAETSPCWKGSRKVSQALKPYGFCRISSWAPVIFGGEATLYWLWRTHRAGHEMMHGALLAASGRPFHIFDEVRRTADELETCADFINGTKVKTDTALLFTSLAWNIFEFQPMLSDLQYQPKLYKYFYEPLVKAGIRPDVIGAKKDLSGYKVLFAPMAVTLEDGDLACRIAAWVKNGGILVTGPMTDLRNAIGARYDDRLYGHLEKLADVKPLYEIPDTRGLIECKWNDGGDFAGKDWYELMESDESALATVTEGYPSLIGTSPLVCKQVGQGKIYCLGTFPSAADMEKIIDAVSAESGIRRLKLDGTLFAAERSGRSGDGLIVAECGGKTGSILLEAEMTDLLTGKRFAGEVQLAPYELLVLKK